MLVIILSAFANLLSANLQSVKLQTQALIIKFYYNNIAYKYMYIMQYLVHKQFDLLY